MSSVDNRVVNMEFNNRDFASKIADTMTSLSKLDKALQFEKGQTGLENISTAANTMNFSGMEAGIQALNNRFSTLGIVGMTVINRLTNGVIDFSRKILGKTLSGGISRAMNLEHANFMLEGVVRNEKQVEAIMSDVRDSVDGTAYSLDQAANVAAQFAATGMRGGEDMQRILKGVTGIAAVFDADYQRVGQIFTQVGAQNRVYANDLLSLSTMGVNAKATLVDYFTTVEKKANVTTETIDEMVKKGDLDFKTFGKAMAWAFGDQAKQANRTFNGAMSNVNAHLAQIGAKFVTPLVETKKSLDGVGDETYNLIDILNSFRGVIDRVRDSLGDFGVYDIWVKSVNKVSEVVSKFLNVIAINADKDVTGFIDSINALQEALGMNDKDFKNLVDTVFGIIDAFKIVKNIFVDFINACLPAGKSVKSLGSFILEVTGSIGRFITNLRDITDKTDFFSNSFMNLGKVISFVGDILKSVFGAIFGLFNGAGGNLASFFNGFIDFFKKFGAAVSPIGKSVVSIFGEIKDILIELFGEIGKAMSSGNTDSLINFLKLLISGGIGLEVVSFLQNINRISQDILTGFSNTDIIRKAKFLFGNLNTVLKEFTVGIRIDNLLKIAKAVGILAASLLLLSLVKPERLFGALIALEVLIRNVSNFMKELGNLTSTGTFKEAANITALAGGIVAISVSLVIMSGAILMLASIPFGKMIQGLIGVGAMLAELVIFMKMLNSKVVKTTAPRIADIAKSMVVMGIALNILAFAVKQLGNLKVQDLAKGLIGIAVLLLELAGFMRLIKKLTVDQKSMVGLIALSVAILLLSKALKTIGKLNPEQLAKGLIGLGFVLLELAGFVKIVSGSAGILSASVGMIAIAAAMTIMTGVLKDLGNLSEEEIAKGLLSLAGSLLIMAGVMKLMSGLNILSASAALIIAAQAICMIADAMSTMGGMSDKEMATGLLVMADSLGALAIALFLMSKSLPGAAALIVAAAAMAILTPSLVALGKISTEGLAIALIAMAGAFTILGVAGYLLGPLVPVILGLSAAMALLGIGMLSAGVGVTAFVGALAFFAQNINLLVQAIPAFLEGLSSSVSAIATIGVQIMVALLQGISSHIGQLVVYGVNAIVNFINGVSSKIGDIVDAGFNLIISFINGMANGLNEHGPELIAAVMNLIGSIVNYSLEGIKQLVDGFGIFGQGAAKEIEKAQKEVSKFFGDGTVKKEVESGAKGTTDAMKKESKKTANAAKKELDAIPKFSKKAMKDSGLSFNVLPKDAKKAFSKVSGDKTLEKDMPKKADKSMDLFSNEFVKEAKRSNAGKKAGTEIADGMDDANYAGAADNSYSGFTDRFLSKNWDYPGDSAADAVLRKFKSKLGVHSPSREFAKVAEFVYLGFANTMNEFNSKFYRVSSNAADAVTNGFKSSLNLFSNDELDSISNPTIRPVVDLSGVKMGASLIGSMFDNYTLRVNGNMAIQSQYDSLEQRMIEQDKMQSKNVDKLVSAISDNGMDPDLVYEAIRAGAADATLRLTLNGRELSRGLRDLGVKFR